MLFLTHLLVTAVALGVASYTQTRSPGEIDAQRTDSHRSRLCCESQSFASLASSDARQAMALQELGAIVLRATPFNESPQEVTFDLTLESAGELLFTAI